MGMSTIRSVLERDRLLCPGFDRVDDGIEFGD